MERSLKEWVDSYQSSEEMEKTFLVMDKTMKYIHDNNYHITNFNPNNISVGNNDGEVYVVFNNIEKMDDNPVNNMNNNIYNLAFLQVGLYSSTLDYLTPQFVKEHFSQFKIFIPESVVNYYQRVLVNQGYFYLSEYVNSKNEIEINKINKSLEEDGGRGSGKNYTKSTAAGRLYKEQEEVIVPNKENNAAFVSSFLLTFAIVSLSILIPLIAFLIGFSR